MSETDLQELLARATCEPQPRHVPRRRRAQAALDGLARHRERPCAQRPNALLARAPARSARREVRGRSPRARGYAAVKSSTPWARREFRRRRKRQSPAVARDGSIVVDDVDARRRQHIDVIRRRAGSPDVDVETFCLLGALSSIRGTKIVRLSSPGAKRSVRRRRRRSQSPRPRFGRSATRSP